MLLSFCMRVLHHAAFSRGAPFTWLQVFEFPVSADGLMAHLITGEEHPSAQTDTFVHSPVKHVLIAFPVLAIRNNITVLATSPVAVAKYMAEKTWRQDSFWFRVSESSAH